MMSVTTTQTQGGGKLNERGGGGDDKLRRVARDARYCKIEPGCGSDDNLCEGPKIVTVTRLLLRLLVVVDIDSTTVD